jgi:hypothetical protein
LVITSERAVGYPSPGTQLCKFYWLVYNDWTGSVLSFQAKVLFNGGQFYIEAAPFVFALRLFGMHADAFRSMSCMAGCAIEMR